MRLGLIGYGGMNRIVAERARDAGHEIAVIVNSQDAACNEEELAAKLRGLDAIIDFSVGEAVGKNVAACMRASVPLVEGTTGWNAERKSILQKVKEADGSLVVAANFSVGVNLFYRIIARAGGIFDKFDAYAPFIEEAHHSRKRDAPSGTALRLGELLAENYVEEIPVSSTRAGFIPGTHRVGFDSEDDQILLVHTARSRRGFAAGALLAAEWIGGRNGIYDFGDVLDEIINEGKRIYEDKT
jgi:4-hydroxy-tetrahydrodipicolinate reductase